MNRDPPLLLDVQLRFARIAEHDLVECLREVRGRDALPPFARGRQRGLVDEVGEVGSREAGRVLGDPLEVHIERQRFPLRVHGEDRLAGGELGPIDENTAVEAAWAQQRGIEHVGTIGGRDDDHEVAALEAVHLRQQLVQRLLALVVAPAEAGAPRAPDRVDLVDEHDGGRALLRVAKQIADARRAEPHEHLDELRCADGIEGHPRFARDRPCQQRLARARRAR
jgi:hypothetical protein